MPWARTKVALADAVHKSVSTLVYGMTAAS
jgi:hypothetical protein